MSSKLSIQPFTGQPPAQATLPVPSSGDHKLSQFILNAVQECNSQNGSLLSADKVSSMSERLAKIFLDNKISANEVQELLAGRFLKVQTFIDHDKMIDIFAQVMGKTLEGYDNQFPFGSPKHRRTTLQKVVSAAFDNNCIAHKGTVTRVEDKEYLLRLKAKRAELFAIQLDTLQFIDEGLFLDVYKAFDLIRFSEVALKKPKIFDRLHFQQFFNEKNTVKEIHRANSEKSLPTNNIKSIPYAIVGLRCEKKGDRTSPISQWCNEVGLIDELYFSNLFDLLAKRPSSQMRLNVCRMLLSCLAAIHAAGFAHGDLKLENILIKDHCEVAHIADFGDAANSSKIIDNPESFKKSPTGTFTSTYCLPSDLIREENLRDMQDMQQASALAIHYRQQRDVFALGIVIASILSSVEPFKCTSSNVDGIGGDNFPDLTWPLFTTYMRSMVPKDKFKPLNELIWKMLNEDPEKRLTAPQALAAWDTSAITSKGH